MGGEGHPKEGVSRARVVEAIPAEGRAEAERGDEPGRARAEPELAVAVEEGSEVERRRHGDAERGGHLGRRRRLARVGGDRAT